MAVVAVVGYCLIIALSIPWYLPQGSFRPLLFGLPYWTVFSVLGCLLFALWTNWVIHTLWRSEEIEVHSEKTSKRPGERPGSLEETPNG